MQQPAESRLSMNALDDLATLERGFVTHCADKVGRRFGFVVVLDDDGNRTSKELFFHYNDRRFADSSGRWLPLTELDATPSRQREPYRGDLLVFRRVAGLKGDKALPWCYAAEFDRVVQTLPLIRVVKIAVNDFLRDDNGRVQEEEIWRGRSIASLSTKFPQRDPERAGRDALEPSSTENGYIVTQYRFEENQGGQWVTCNDPR